MDKPIWRRKYKKLSINLMLILFFLSLGASVYFAVPTCNLIIDGSLWSFVGIAIIFLFISAASLFLYWAIDMDEDKPLRFTWEVKEYERLIIKEVAKHEET